MPRKFADTEQQRAYWREQAARAYRGPRHEAIKARNRASSRRRYAKKFTSHPCRRCGVALTNTKLGICASCRACRICGHAVPVGKGSPLAFCSTGCRTVWRAQRRGAGKVYRVWGHDCAHCSTRFVSHGPGGPNEKWCSDACRRLDRLPAQRRRNREYQRRTRYTAIRYWTVDSSAEALDLATLYYGLRQELRAWRKSGVNSGR